MHISNKCLYLYSRVDKDHNILEGRLSKYDHRRILTKGVYYSPLFFKVKINMIIILIGFFILLGYGIYTIYVIWKPDSDPLLTKSHREVLKKIERVKETLRKDARGEIKLHWDKRENPFKTGERK